MSDEVYVYIARIPCCNRIVYVSVDRKEHAKDTAREVAKHIREGFPVQRIPLKEAQAEQWGCECKREKRHKASRQGALL